MRKTHLLPLLILPLLGSCDRDRHAIEQAAHGYLDAMGNYRIEQAEPYATEQTINTTLRFVEKHIMPAAADTNGEFAAYIRNNTPATIEITSVSLTSDTTATISFTKTTPTQRQTGEKELRKRNGQWLVHEIIQVPPIVQAATQPDSLRLQGRRTKDLKPIPLIHKAD